MRVGGEVHQLHAALHDPCPGGAEPVVDQLEQVGVEQVLGVGDADPGKGDLELVQHLHGGVEADRLVVHLALLRIRAHQDLAGVLARLGMRDRRRARVVGVVDDRHHPVVGVVQPRQPLQRLARDRLLMPHRDQDHPGKPRRIRLTVAVRVVVLRPPPLVQLERQRGRGDQDHEDRDDENEPVGEEHRRHPGQHRPQEQPPHATRGGGAVCRVAWTHGGIARRTTSTCPSRSSPRHRRPAGSSRPPTSRSTRPRPGTGRCRAAGSHPEQDGTGPTAARGRPRSRRYAAAR